MLHIITIHSGIHNKESHIFQNKVFIPKNEIQTYLDGFRIMRMTCAIHKLLKGRIFT